MRSPAIFLASVAYIFTIDGAIVQPWQQKERQQPNTFTVDGHTYVIDPPIRRQIPTPIRPLPDVPFDKDDQPEK